jgi:5-methylcytosine-specific restriction endonuclease McrA
VARLLLTSGGTVPLDGPRRDTRRGRHRDPLRRLRSTGEYQRLRAQVFAEEPACATCGSESDPHMDHIVPLSQAPHRALDRSNVRRLCGSCNTRRGAPKGGEGRLAGPDPHPRLPSVAMRTGLVI